MEKVCEKLAFFDQYLALFRKRCKIRRDLKMLVRGRSRSLKMAPFDRSHMSSYSSSIVTVAVSCTVFEIKRYIGRWSHCLLFAADAR